MINLFNFLSVFYLLASLSSCDSSNNQQNQPLGEEYKSCCGLEPVEYSKLNPSGFTDYLYIPNVFTPNGDGINDRFIPVFNDSVEMLRFFNIQQEVFDDTTSPILHDVVFVDRSNASELSWDGKKPDGTPYKGSFSYYIFCVTKRQSAFIVEGKACAVLCEPDSYELKNNPNCFYPSQADSRGKFNKSISNLETNCFR